MIDLNLKKRHEETELAFIYRLGKLKDDGVVNMTWGELADVMNKQLRDPDEEWTESAYRKKYALIRDAYEQIFSGYQNDDYLKELTLQKQEIQKEKRKLYDERLDLNRRLREEARFEESVDRIEKALNSVSERLFDNNVTDIPTALSDNKMIICLSDLHIGESFKNSDGEYNSDIAKFRLEKYIAEVKHIQSQNNCGECVVAILGDCISGSIHRTISVTNKEDVVEQVKIASMLIAEFIDVLSNMFTNVRVYSVGGNHSRIEKKAEDALLSERLDNLIPWFIEKLMVNKKNVEVCSNTFDDTLGMFTVGDKTYFLQHGDYTSMNDSAIGKLVLWAKQTPYCILTGHMHFPAMIEVSGIKVIQSGSLCGSGDEFTRQKRLTGKPSQTVIVTKDNGSIYGVFPVEL